MTSMTPAKRFRLVSSVLMCPLLLTGCAGMYFRDLETAPQPAPQHKLSAWPVSEYWTGVVFNGEKIGLTHLALVSSGEVGGSYELRSEALLAFHFLGFRKQVTLKARDWVTEDLHLERFRYDYDLDGQKLALSGRVERGQLVVERKSGGRATTRTMPLDAPTYPTSAMILYPTLHGLEVGKEYTYLVYDGQRERVARVSQAIDAYQESDLYNGRAFRVVTSMDGQRSTIWINERGEPVLEMAWHGTLISELETEKRAKAYLARASLNKRDVLMDFSRVRTNVVLEQPSEVTNLQVVLEGLPETFIVPSDQFQRCGRRGDTSDGHVRCVIQSSGSAARTAHRGGVGKSRGSSPADGRLSAYLRSSPTVQSEDERIQSAARQIAGDGDDPLSTVHDLVAWIQRNVKPEPVDVFSAADVFEGRRAECQGLSWLYTAFARSLGIPTRVTNGLVYSRELEGFLYHTWTESYIGSQWLPVDPTFGQIGVDATHIKLLEGERSADLLPLVDVVGKIHIQILSYQPS